MVAGITPVLNAAGYQVLLANTDNNASREVDFLRLFSEKNQVDGVILIATVITEEHREAISSLPVPIVVLDQDVDFRSCVFQNDYEGMREVASIGAALRQASGLHRRLRGGRRRRADAPPGVSRRMRRGRRGGARARDAHRGVHR